MTKNRVEFKENVAEYYAQFQDSRPVLHDIRFITDRLPQLTRDLVNIEVNLYFIKWSRQIFEENPTFEYEYFKNDHDLKNNYLFFSERELYFASTGKEGTLHIKHKLTREVIPKLNAVLKRYFPKRTLGYQQDCESITIHLEPQEHLIVSKKKQSLSIDFTFSDKNLRGDSQPFVEEIKEIIRGHGFVDEYDASVGPIFSVELQIDVDSIESIQHQLRTLDRLGGESVKMIKMW